MRNANARSPQTTPIHDESDEWPKLYPEFQRLLVDRRNTVLQSSQNDRDQLDEQVLTSPGDVGDASVIDTSADYYLNLADNHRRELMEIQDALDRIRRGVYGFCETCGESITAERLRRVPTARQCIDDQQAQEKRLGAARLQILPKL